MRREQPQQVAGPLRVRHADPAADRFDSWQLVCDSTHPKSHFVTGLLVALVTADARYNLSGRNLAIHRGCGTETVVLDGAAAVLDTLRDRFGIDIDCVGERGAAEARLDGILRP